jgi:hypothetical protein
MNQVQADEELGLPGWQSSDRVQVPHFIEQGSLTHGGGGAVLLVF